MKVVPRTGITIAADGTSGTFTLNGTPATYALYRGKNVRTVVEIPNWTNEVTLEWKIADPAGNRFYHKDSLAKNQLAANPVIIDEPFPIFEGCVVTCTLSGVPGASGGLRTIYTTIYYEREGR